MRSNYYKEPRRHRNKGRPVSGCSKEFWLMNGSLTQGAREESRLIIVPADAVIRYLTTLLVEGYDSRSLQTRRLRSWGSTRITVNVGAF